ncbi:MAG: RNA polymerase sigma factor [Solirubrobacteraceae bacterium]
MGERAINGQMTASPSPPTRSAAPDDAHVISASLADPERFATIFDRHHDRIAAYVRRRLTADGGDELAAQTFLIAFEQRARYDRAQRSAAPWLYGIATNLLRRHHRSETRRWKAYATHGETGAPAVDTSDLDARADASAAGPALARSLARLRRDDRDTLLLFAWADLTYPEIAAALSIPIGTVRSRINRARRLLAAELDLPAPTTEPAMAPGRATLSTKESE